MTRFSGASVLEARDRIAPFIHHTPVLTCSAFNEKVEASIFFKCENFQKTGSFKFRGACNAVASLTESERARGVLTHSSGNYAQALALAARLHGTPAYVVMPENAPGIKKQATAGYGATITLCPPTQAGRHETAERIREETGAIFLDSHDDPRVFAGQGTACLELIEEIGELDLILAPVGGGGLLSGTLLAAKHLLPKATVIGCEPAGADDAARGIALGERIIDFVPHTIADGLRTPLGENTFEIIRDMADDIVLVSEANIVRSMRFIWERMKIVIEPSSAVAVAPLLNGSVGVKGKRVGVILSGGNVDLTQFFEL
ncbi:pyridoxal-phosphate dependent enzyme, partial [Candidatus Bipolaricaulota bacterium]|nr:pyridoxal-phosphate dependent enzyme [Candidatus Bipolaricaulota bacterium]